MTVCTMPECQTTAGCVCKSVPSFEGAEYVCEVPEALGQVTKLEVKRGKVIAHTTSGTKMIVPVK